MLRLVTFALGFAIAGTAAPAVAQGVRTAAAAPAPKVSGTWVRLPAVSGRPAAGYLEVAGTGVADALVGARSPLAERVEIHSMTHENGVIRMRREAALEVPAGGKLALAPGGAHLMLFGLSADVKPGQRLPVTLSFRSGATVTVEAETRAAAAPAAASGSKAPAPAHSH